MKNFLYIAIVVVIAVCAQDITVYNNTTRDLYTALYVTKNNAVMANQASNLYYIEAGQSIAVQQSDSSDATYQLLFAEDKAVFAAQVTTQTLNSYNAYTLGYFDTVYLGDDEGTITGYDELEWYIYEKPLQAAYDELVNLFPSLNNNPYKDQQASLRLGNNLCDQEIAYAHQRLPVLQACLAVHGKPTANVPKIAVVCSGGGCRAALYTAGALYALEQMKLLDAVSWVSALSGSTWAVNTWMSSGASAQKFFDWLVNNTQFDMQHLHEQDFTLMGEIIATKYLTSQPVGFVDLYGSWLANDFFPYFSNNPGAVVLSNQAPLVSTATVPLPIYSAINASDKYSQQWYEFTPFEIGASWMGAIFPPGLLAESLRQEYQYLMRQSKI